MRAKRWAVVIGLVAAALAWPGGVASSQVLDPTASHAMVAHAKTLPLAPLSVCVGVQRGFGTACEFTFTGPRLIVGGAITNAPKIKYKLPPPMILLMHPTPLPDPLPTPIITLPEIRIEIDVLTKAGDLVLRCTGSGSTLVACDSYAHINPTGEILVCKSRWPGFGPYGCASL